MTDILNIPVAILAGGLATRMRPLTSKTPKSLLNVAGKPFIAHQLELLRKQGIRKVVVCLGYLGERVVEEFGDGHAYDLEIGYSFDGDKLLGTGGALRKALPQLGERFFVLYGDSYLTEPFAPIAEHFERSGKSGLMTVYRNNGLHDKSNIVFVDGEIVRYDKKAFVPEMLYIDYGLSMLAPSAFSKHKDGEAFDLSVVLQDLLRAGDLAAFEVKDRFYEIGSISGLKELDALLGGKSLGESK